MFILVFAVLLPFGLMNKLSGTINPGVSSEESDNSGIETTTSVVSSETSYVNKDYPMQSGVWGIQRKESDPFYSSIVITSLEEIQLYIERCNEEEEDMVDEQLFSALSVYDNNFFIKNALIVLTAYESSSSTRREIQVTHRDNSTYISLADINPSAEKDQAEAVWTYLIPVQAEHTFNQKLIESDLRYAEIEQDKNFDHNQPIKDSGIYKVEIDTSIGSFITNPSDIKKRKFIISVTVKCIAGTYYTGNGPGIRAPDITILDKYGKQVLYSNFYYSQLNTDDEYKILKKGETNVIPFVFYESETITPNSVYNFPTGTFNIKITNPGIEDLYIKDAIIIQESRSFKTELT